MTYSIGNASKQRLINPDFNMTPGSPYRLTCPKCGGRKLIGSIASGNTFGEMIWSDTKHDYPMLPRPSSIQRCPDCGHYYFLDDGNPVNTGKAHFSLILVNCRSSRSMRRMMSCIAKRLGTNTKMRFYSFGYSSTMTGLAAVSRTRTWRLAQHRWLIEDL